MSTGGVRFTYCWTRTIYDQSRRPASSDQILSEHREDLDFLLMPDFTELCRASFTSEVRLHPHCCGSLPHHHPRFQPQRSVKTGLIKQLLLSVGQVVCRVQGCEIGQGFNFSLSLSFHSLSSFVCIIEYKSMTAFSNRECVRHYFRLGGSSLRDSEGTQKTVKSWRQIREAATLFFAPLPSQQVKINLI